MSRDRKELYNAVNSLDIGVLITNKYGIINYLNKEALKILKLNVSSVLNKKVSDIFDKSKMKSYLKTNNKYNIDVLEYNGTNIIMTKKQIVNNKSIDGTLIIFQCLNTCKKIIRQFDNKIGTTFLLETIMKTINDSIVYVNKEGYIEMISNSYAKFLGVDRDEVVGKHVTEVIPNTRLHIVVRTGKSEKAEIQEIDSNKMIGTRIPVVINGKIVGAVGKVLFRDIDELNALYKKISRIERELNLYKDEFQKANKAKYFIDSIVSKSKSMDELKKLTKRVAKTNSNVLILGESGTGKELFAHSIHNCSKRTNLPFVKIDCGAIPHDLIESELFGYEEGAFTGAKKSGKIGKFKAADKGTIFLDEIGDLPMNMQVKLLRVLQDKEIEKIGSNEPEKVDVRVIAATNKDLEEMVRQGKFRLDLYFRLNVLTINIPPLRERKDDISILSKYLIKKISRRESIRVDKITDSTLEYLKRYNWPGNVRELENTLERAINFLDKETIIQPKHLPPKITGIMRNKKIRNLKTTLEEVERQVIIDSLIFSNGNKTKAAKILDISRTSLYEKINKYSIDI